VYDRGLAPGSSAGELVPQAGLPVEGNVRGPARASRGDVAQGLASAAAVIDGMGGGFGSKSTLGNYGRIGVALSRQAGAPVRLTLTRPEEQMDAGNRPATVQRIRLGARRDGTLTAI